MNIFYQRLCLAVSCTLIATTAQAQNIYLVSPNGGTTASAHTTITSSDWSGASTLQAALVAANADSGNPEIWVKAGTYMPAVFARDSSFVITKDGLKLYGGFAGTETSASQRDIASNPVTLSGDVGVQNTITDNSYHVMIILPLSGNISSNTVIDGFTISGSYNVGAGVSTTMPYLNGQYIFNGYGGLLISINNDGTGLYNANTTYYNCSPSISHCSFQFHTGGNSGGAGVYVKGFEAVCSPSFTSCSFTANASSGQGGAIYYSNGTSGAGTLASATVAITNCKFLSNKGTNGGAVYFSGSSSQAPATLNVKGCSFNINSASGSSGGGALMLTGSSTACNIDSSFFVGDTGRLGGAIYSTLNTATSPLTISKSYFYSNKGYLAGGTGSGGTSI